MDNSAGKVLRWRPALRLALAGWLFPLAAIALLGLVSSFCPGLDLFTTFLTVGALALWLAVVVVVLICLLVTRRWRQGLVLVAAALLVWPCARPANELPGYVHLAILWPSYMRRVDPTHQTRFDWGMSGFPGASSVQQTLVYDPPDQVSKDNFTPRIFGESDAITVRHLVGHYYLVYEVQASSAAPSRTRVEGGSDRMLTPQNSTVSLR